ncbi:hypothetical protein KEJ34_07020 [Candidatus Bathyarchaeota archaeon]|nr:hypothetical protein [Candidatus Bathyarchaeota archaeon]
MVALGGLGGIGVKRILDADKGQVRMFEAVIAAIIIFSIFSASIFLIMPSRTWVLHEKEDLDRLGYNVLHSLIETDAVESVLTESGGNAASRLKMLIEETISPSMYYNLTIFKCEDNTEVVSVSNISPDEFGKLPEKSSTTAIYTSRGGENGGESYYIILVLAKGR